MRSSFSHLPLTRQKTIISITEKILQAVVADKIILFGSCARGKFVEHRYFGKDGILYEYSSDYDVLVIVPQLIEKEYITEERIREKTDGIRQAVNVVVHDLDFVNESLAQGWYFFSEIVQEGIIVYDESEIPLSTAKLLTEEEKLERSRQFFDRWMKRYREYRIDAKNAFDRGSYNNSNFLLQQAAETLYYTLLLVYTGYKPKSHHLYKLRQQAKNHSEELYLYFNLKHSKEDARLFDLLNRGYVDARYDDHYFISREDLSALMLRVDDMESIVTAACMSREAAAISK